MENVFLTKTQEKLIIKRKLKVKNCVSLSKRRNLGVYTDQKESKRNRDLCVSRMSTKKTEKS